jgi:hypothetical protein
MPFTQFTSASSLRESTASTRQGEDIGLLTKMTVVSDSAIFIADSLANDIGLPSLDIDYCKTPMLSSVN